MAFRPNAHVLPVDWAELIPALGRAARSSRMKAFYDSCITEPRTPLDQVPLAALDFETTGLEADRDSIVSIGLVHFDLNRIYCRQARYWLVKPDRPMAERSVLVHGITHGDIDSAEELNTILEVMLESLSGRMVIVHYHDIERQFLEQAALRRLDESIQFPLIDTMLIEKAAPKRRKIKLLSLWGKREPISYRLADCRARYGLPVYRQHHALTDAIATAELFQAQAAYHFPSQTPVSHLWV